MILPGSLIPSDKYFLKNLTFVVRNPLVWLRHHSSQTLYVARVKSKQLKKKKKKKQCPSWPTGWEVIHNPVDQEGHCFLVVCSSPWPRKEFDWNGDVATRVDCVPQRLNSLRNIYPKG